MCFHTIDGRKWTYFLLCCRNSDTQTFNGEDELAGVLASIGGHPALPQSSLLSTQTRDLKQCCTLIWVHDSARGLRIQHITHNRNAGLKKKTQNTHSHFLCLLFQPLGFVLRTLRHFSVPVGSAGTILYQIVSIIKETAQKEKHRNWTFRL